MSDISARTLLSRVGANPAADQSLLLRLFGFRRRRVPADPVAGVTASVSLRALAEDYERPHIHVNVIAMGFDAFGAGEAAAIEELDYCVLRLRDIYRPRNIGVRRVLHFEVDAADADGFDVIAGGDEATDLWRSFSVDNNGIDAFVVRSISGLLGRSPRPGRCSKGNKRDGLVAGGVQASHDSISRTFAHEIGHYLGLRHNHDDGTGTQNCPTTTTTRRNLMAQTRCTDNPPAVTVRNAILITGAQGSTMRDHCMVRGG